MSRIRSLKPEFFDDEDLAEHPFWIRILYEGLWVNADREGRLEDRPKKLKIKIFPYDKKVDIEKGLQDLSKIKGDSERPFIIRYEIKGERYIQIVKWKKHQKPHHTERDSEIPAMEEIWAKHFTPVAKQSNGESTVKSPLNTKKLFEEIWDKYPSRINKKAAKRHFEVSVKTKKDWENIQKALKNYLESKRVKSGYIQNGSTWFGNWQDWIDLEELPCSKCKDTGILTSEKGYESFCDCPAGERKRIK